MVVPAVYVYVWGAFAYESATHLPLVERDATHEVVTAEIALQHVSEQPPPGQPDQPFAVFAAHAG